MKVKICCYTFLVAEGKLTINPSTVNTILSPYFDIPQGSSLILKGNTIFAGTGGLVSGNIQGLLEITDSPTGNPSITGTFFFDADGEITFNNTRFQGSGIFISRVNVLIPENSTVIFDGFIFSNQQNFKMEASSSVILDNGSEFSNTPLGLIESNGGTIIGIDHQKLNNAGNINLLNGTDFNTINLNLINSGVINIEEGNFIMGNNSLFENQYEYYQDPDFPEIIYEYYGEVVGSGTFIFPTYNSQTINNDAVFSPEPGITTLHTENFSQSTTGILKIDIESLTNFDKIINSGTTYFEGDFEVALNYSPTLGDEFIVFQSDTPISSCNPVLTTTATYNNLNYVFDVICNTNTIVLKLSEILNTDEFLVSNIDFYVYPNPVSDTFSFNLLTSLDSEKNITIAIFDVIGQVVREIDVKKSTMIFNKKNLKHGVYFAQLKKNGTVLATTKLVVN